MNKRVVAISLVVLMLAGRVALGADPIKFEQVEGPYRLFTTQNMWTRLLLDTRSGRLWQVQFSVDKGGRFKIPINDQTLVSTEDAKANGRFTLYPTDNMWTFLLLDQQDGRIWQCQFTVDDKGQRGIIRIPDVTPKQE